MFVIPFFFIVGFDKDGAAAKFFWYWLFIGLNISVMVFVGQFYASALPDEGVAQVLAGMTSTINSLFCGFMIRSQDIPTFWQFVYWLCPLHYCLEGLVFTQFNGDDTEITTISGEELTAYDYVKEFFEEWDYSHRVADFMALIIFIIVLRLATYLALEYVRHDKR